MSNQLLNINVLESNMAFMRRVHEINCSENDLTVIILTINPNNQSAKGYCNSMLPVDQAAEMLRNYVNELMTGNNVQVKQV